MSCQYESHSRGVRCVRRVADFSGKRDFENIVNFVINNANGVPLKHGAQSSQEASAKRSSIVGWLRARATSLLTDYSPIEAALAMLAVAVSCGVCMLIALVLLSKPSTH